LIFFLGSGNANASAVEINAVIYRRGVLSFPHLLLDQIKSKTDNNGSRKKLDQNR
jgi:hypothetical protein